MNRLPVIIRQHIAAFRALLVFTVLCGLIYPAVMVGVSQVAFHKQANGSMVSYNGRTVGSSLLCQEFADAKGNPLPQYFQPRPSNAGGGYDGSSSGASNLGPSNPTLINEVSERVRAYRQFNHMAPAAAVPVDAVTASGSGLDPDISLRNALDQAPRVAEARHLPPARVLALLHQQTAPAEWGFLSERAVNVLQLNLALDGLR